MQTLKCANCRDLVFVYDEGLGELTVPVEAPAGTYFFTVTLADDNADMPLKKQYQFRIKLLAPAVP